MTSIGVQSLRSPAYEVGQGEAGPKKSRRKTGCSRNGIDSDSPGWMPSASSRSDHRTMTARVSDGPHL